MNPTFLEISFKNKIIHFSIISILLLLIYSSVLIKSPTLTYDDEDLIFPMKEVSTFSQYFEKVNSGEILDRTPIRDLSYWLELKTEEISGFRNSQLVNLLFWIGSLFVFSLILNQLLAGHFLHNQNFYFPVLYLTALHPVVVPSIAWSASRKHILSCFFILLATLFLFKKESPKLTSTKKQNTFFMVSFYTFSVLSQPINLLWVLFAFSYSLFQFTKQKELNTRIVADFLKKNVLWFIALLTILIALVAINQNYYSGDLFKATQGESSAKILDESWLNFARRFHVLGRYFMQLIFPIWASPAPYQIFDFRSLLGICLVTFSTAAFIKRKHDFKRYFVSFSFFIGPILVMTLRLTQHGGWDTYLLSSLFGFMLILYQLAEDSSLLTENLKKLSLPLFLVLMFFIFLSYQQADQWTSEDKLWSYSNEKEQTVYVKAALAKNLLKQKGQMTPEIETIIKEIKVMNPESKALGYLLGRMYYSSSIDISQKQELIKSVKIDSPWLSYYLAATYAQTNDFNQALKIIDEKYQENPKKFVYAFNGVWKDIAKKWYKICMKASALDCQSRIDKINQYLSEKNKVYLTLEI